MDTKNVFLIMRKEAVESLRNRWFILYTLCFSALALLVLLFSTMGGDIAGFSGFGRTAASLINLVLLFVPLIAIITGGMSISQERENGTLPYLLSHPINKNEIFVGKFLGILITIWFSILLGFGLAGLGVAIRGGEGEISGYLLTVILSALLAACFLSIGFLVSVYSGKASKAIGISVFLWLLFIILGDLGIMGTTVAMAIRRGVGQNQAGAGQPGRGIRLFGAGLRVLAPGRSVHRRPDRNLAGLQEDQRARCHAPTCSRMDPCMTGRCHHLCHDSGKLAGCGDGTLCLFFANCADDSF